VKLLLTLRTRFPLKQVLWRFSAPWQYGCTAPLQAQSGCNDSLWMAGSEVFPGTL
jgi:hypothetical protein